MERSAQVRFSNSKFVHDARYIHKYYLPQELRNKIFPVDKALMALGASPEYN